MIRPKKVAGQLKVTIYGELRKELRNLGRTKILKVEDERR